jgi:hypothetical protein
MYPVQVCLCLCSVFAPFLLLSCPPHCISRLSPYNIQSCNAASETYPISSWSMHRPGIHLAKRTQWPMVAGLLQGLDTLEVADLITDESVICGYIRVFWGNTVDNCPANSRILRAFRTYWATDLQLGTVALRLTWHLQIKAENIFCRLVLRF